jgi:oxygen-independent coproporphyrinogen-3 oxidase
MIGFYLHVPFCAKVCAYCDFAVLAAPLRVQRRYVELAQREAQIRWSRDAKNQSIRTVYLGGGTPTELQATDLGGLLDGMRAIGLIPPGLAEFSVECNPENLTEDRLATLAENGVDRFSLGVQTLSPRLLEAVGRKSDPDISRAAVERLVKTGSRVSCDLMFSLPGQSVSQFLADLEELTSMGVGHASFYGLSVEGNTLLGQQVSRGDVLAPDDLYADFYRQGVASLESKGIFRYEVSNFSRPGQEGIHNRSYWERREYLGIGPGAHSFLGGVRMGAPKAFSRWASWVEEGCPIAGMSLDPIGPAEARVEAIWLGLRQSAGLDLLAFEEEFSKGLDPKRWREFELADQVRIQDGRLQITGEGFCWIDRIVQTLLS